MVMILWPREQWISSKKVHNLCPMFDVSECSQALKPLASLAATRTFAASADLTAEIEHATGLEKYAVFHAFPLLSPSGHVSQKNDAPPKKRIFTEHLSVENVFLVVSLVNLKCRPVAVGSNRFFSCV